VIGDQIDQHEDGVVGAFFGLFVIDDAYLHDALVDFAPVIGESCQHLLGSLAFPLSGAISRKVKRPQVASRYWSPLV